MPKNKLQKFCDLSKALKEQDSEFHQALDDLCLLPLLRPGPSGITFLYPKSKKVRDSIIKKTYSKNPEEAIKQVKALILRGCYHSPDSLPEQVPNALHQLLSISSGKLDKFKISKDDHEYFYHRGDSIAMLVLEGDGEIPTSGEPAPRMEHSELVKKRKTKTGGGWNLDCCWPSNRVSLARKLEKLYVSERNKKSNVYVKKVVLQLRILKKDHPELYLSKVPKYLGAEEITDSYLLDMISPKDVLHKLWELFGENDDGMGMLSDDIPKTRDEKNQGKTYYQLYKEIKTELINEHFKDIPSLLNKNKNEQLRLIDSVVSVSDLREVVCSAYGNKNQLGKDLFIIYTLLMKEMWESEGDLDSFHHYSYMAINIYTSCESMVDQEFNQFKDATLYGNLIKSEIFKYVPSMDAQVYVSAGYTAMTHMPKPIKLDLYSIMHLLSRTEKVGGGNSILSEYL
jgi:hypothetical protein